MMIAGCRLPASCFLFPGRPFLWYRRAHASRCPHPATLPARTMVPVAVRSTLPICESTSVGPGVDGAQQAAAPDARNEVCSVECAEHEGARAPVSAGVPMRRSCVGHLHDSSTIPAKIFDHSRTGPAPAGATRTRSRPWPCGHHRFDRDDSLLPVAGCRSPVACSWAKISSPGNETPESGKHPARAERRSPRCVARPRRGGDTPWRGSACCAGSPASRCCSARSCLRGPEATSRLRASRASSGSG